MNPWDDEYDEQYNPAPDPRWELLMAVGVAAVFLGIVGLIAWLVVPV
jgi:hypothetical protein